MNCSFQAQMYLYVGSGFLFYMDFQTAVYLQARFFCFHYYLISWFFFSKARIYLHTTPVELMCYSCIILRSTLTQHVREIHLKDKLDGVNKRVQKHTFISSFLQG